MTRLNASAGNMNLPVFKVFYSATYDRAVFNDGRTGNRNQLQTQDVWLRNGCTNTNYVKDYFDMATLKWYDKSYVNGTAANNYNDAKLKYTSTVLVHNFNTNGSTWAHNRMVYYTDGTQGTNDHYFMTRVHIKSTGTYQFMIYDGGNSRHYGKPDGWGNWDENYGATMRDINDHQYESGYVVDVKIDQIHGNGVYRVFYDKDSHYMIWQQGEDNR